MLDELAESFARHVDAGEQLEAGGGPGSDTAFKNGNIRIAEACEPFCRALREAVVIVDQHDARRRARHQGTDPQLESAQRQRTRVQQMAERNGRIYHLRGVAALARDFFIRTIGAQRMLARQDWIYDWQA